MIGDLIGHYRVLELIGRGAMGVVYKALDVNLDRPVAIKVMSVEARGDPDFVERFRQEARMQAALNHPNVALLFDYFIHNDAPVAVMEFIDGESLEQLIRRRGAIPAHESIPIFKQALRGVAAAHHAGIIHRDLKASNLMITKAGIVKVMDFGIAKRQGFTGATKASTSIGSPLYMAPEQILGRPVDCRTDVYALGVTLYQLLSGQPPFNPRGKTEYSVLDAHVNDLPEPPTVLCRTIPQPIVNAVMRALAKDPDARFQSADEFMRALPDVSVPNAAAVVRLGPTGTVALKDSPALRLGPTGTVALDDSPQTTGNPVATGKAGGTMVFEYGATMARAAHDAISFDYSAATLRQESRRDNATPPSPASSPAAQGSRAALSDLRQFQHARPAIVVVLVATLVLGILIHDAKWLHATLRGAPVPISRPHFRHAQASTAAPQFTEPVAPPSPTPSSEAEASAAAPLVDAIAPTAGSLTAPPLATATEAARPDLSGTWRGEYVDASGKQVFRVISLSIRRVYNDGGIEGTLQYEASTGDGECKLHPRGSTYWADEQRLQLSPEGCSPHYPKELGVPLDFDGVNPQAQALTNGRIEAPGGAVIRVKLKRVS
jgi:serine/threonine protein kinase